MSNDRHPLIKKQSELDGWSQHVTPDPGDVIGLQQYKFLVSQPDHRAKALHDLDAAIDADESANLRQKSEIVRLRRELSKTHEAMLKAGR